MAELGLIIIIIFIGFIVSILYMLWISSWFIAIKLGITLLILALLFGYVSKVKEGVMKHKTGKE